MVTRKVHIIFCSICFIFLGGVPIGGGLLEGRVEVWQILLGVGISIVGLVYALLTAPKECNECGGQIETKEGAGEFCGVESVTGQDCKNDYPFMTKKVYLITEYYRKDVETYKYLAWDECTQCNKKSNQKTLIYTSDKNRVVTATDRVLIRDDSES